MSEADYDDVLFNKNPLTQSQRLDGKSERMSSPFEMRSSKGNVKNNVTIMKMNRAESVEASSIVSSGSLKQPSSLLTTVQKPAQSALQGYDKLFKIILVGSAASGKTSLVNRFVEDIFQEDALTTIGMDLKSVTLKVEDIAVRLQIWDTAGQEQFSALTRQYFRGCQGAIFVFDLTQQASLNSLTKQLLAYKEECPPEAQNNMVLVGNKSDDFDNRIVTYD